MTVRPLPLPAPPRILRRLIGRPARLIARPAAEAPAERHWLLACGGREAARRGEGLARVGRAERAVDESAAEGGGRREEGDGAAAPQCGGVRPTEISSAYQFRF